MVQRHDIVIVGGGNAGISLAGRARRLGFDDVAVIDPGPVHRYRPLLNYVAGGQASLDRLTKPMRSVIPDGCTWIARRAAGVDTDAGEVELDDGSRVAYGDLVLAPGLVPDLGAVRGLEEAMRGGWASTGHLASSAANAWRAIQRTRQGTVVFSIPPEPSPCGGTALKPLFLACDHWQREGVLTSIDVHLATPYEAVLDLPFVEAELEQSLRRFGVTVHHRATVRELDSASRWVILDTAGDEAVVDKVEEAFIVPPYRAPEWLAPLAGEDPAGLVDIDPETLAHRRVPRLWSLGDVAAVQTRPSGGALRRQVDILADNLRRSRDGEPLRRYDGYTIIPITVDRRRLLLAEFDRTGTPQPTVERLDLSVPRRSLWAFDRYVEPVVYFRALLKGRV
jgi:sulfide:quinone oxidoreductase